MLQCLAGLFSLVVVDLLIVRIDSNGIEQLFGQQESVEAAAANATGGDMYFAISIIPDLKEKSKLEGAELKTLEYVDSIDLRQSSFLERNEEAFNSLQQYAWDLLWEGQTPRSVYSLRAKIDPHRLGYEDEELKLEMVKVARVFCSDAEIENAVNSSEAAEFSEPYFDGLRIKLYEKLPSVPDFVRSLYSGKFNVALIVLGLGVFRWIKCNHKLFTATNVAQAPPLFFDSASGRSAGTAFVRNSSEPEQIPRLVGGDDLEWSRVWSSQGLSDLLSFLNLHKDGPQPRSIASVQVKATLDELEVNRGQWYPYECNVQKQSVYDSISSLNANRAFEERKEFSRTRDENTEAWPERLIEFGFMGTVIGLMLAMASLALTQVPSDDPLYHSAAVGQLAVNLRLCFSTTFWGLVFAVWLRSSTSKWRKVEDTQAYNLTLCIDQFFRVNKDRVRHSTANLPTIIETNGDGNA